MVSEIRKTYNKQFSNRRYHQLLDWVARQHAYRPSFRIAETPVFIPRSLKQKLFQATEEIIDVITRPDFKALSESALPPNQRVPGEDEHTQFLQMDFGICFDEEGGFSPQLIEVQGFPSLYFFQHFIARAYKQHFYIPDNYSHLFNDITPEEYIAKLRNIILAGHSAENVILMEVDPAQQNTQIDFIIAEHLLGIRSFCISELIVEGKKAYYRNDAGKKIRIRRIFNRVIFDELVKRNDLIRSFCLTDEMDVEWAGHPNWFFRISKHTMPFLKSRFVPDSYFLHELDPIPEDLHNYVLKPLFSFSGAGVIIDPAMDDILKIKDKHNFILQKKVEYAPVVQTLTGSAKCEIRMLMLWERGTERPVIVNNLARLSKGKMVGVKYNKDRTWVGGSVGFFEE